MTRLLTIHESRAENLPEGLRKVMEARHPAPFSLLGPHPAGEVAMVRTFQPGAVEVAVEGCAKLLTMQRIGGTAFFEWVGPAHDLPRHYRLILRDGHGRTQAFFDPYSFPPQIPDFDLHLFGEGRHRHAYRFLGAQPVSVDGIAGVLFGVWAPNAERVSVVGDFNRWDGRCHAMQSRNGGVWEIFIPGLPAGTLYKFELRDRSGSIHVKTDPYGRRFELRPSNAARVETPEPFPWSDDDWLTARADRDWLHTPMSIYEVHLGSWQRDREGAFLDYRELAHRLVDYVVPLGFTHIELLPVTEHPYDGSWGYQSTGYFAPTSRFGKPDDLRYLVDYCHRHGIGVILDWVPAHFPRDGHALARFDGSALYEYQDTRRGEHREWGTLVFNYGRNEVRAFLISSAVFWLEEFHFDGLRVDAVAAMLYLDYARRPGEWLPNRHGGREHLEAVSLIRELNEVIHGRFPGALTLAEESTAWPQVSRPVHTGGLGFSMKWNLGWMNDTLAYMHRDPIHRRYHHNELTFGLMYAFAENFVLPFSHDEVVHLKRSMLEKMPGDDWQRFANLRLLYLYLFTMPGKKLLFMGGEFGQRREWDFETELEWQLLERAPHRGLMRLVGDLNRLYRELPALHRYDFEQQGFEWLDCHDADWSRLAFVRSAGQAQSVVVLNFTPVPHPGYRLGVPAAGRYRTLLNTDSGYYGGSDAGPCEWVDSSPVPAMGRSHSIELTLPPLGGLVLQAGPRPQRLDAPAQTRKDL